MLGLVGVARNVAVEELVKHLLRGLLLSSHAAAGDEVRGGLELAAHLEEVAGNLRVLLDGAVALRVGDDDVIAHALQGKDGALVVLEVCLGAAGVKLQQELARTLEAQVRRPLLKAQLHELGMVDLKAHGYGEAASRLLEAVVGVPEHVQVLEVGAAHMGSAHDAGHAGLLGGVQHDEASLHVWGPVVNAGQDVAVHVSHRASLPSGCVWWVGAAGARGFRSAGVAGLLAFGYSSVYVRGV